MLRGEISELLLTTMKSQFLDSYSDYLIGLFVPVTAAGLSFAMVGALSCNQTIR